MTLHEKLIGSLALEDEPKETTMSTAIMKAPELRDQPFSRDKVELIKRTIAVGASDDELELFLYTAKRTGLDPLARQIYAIKRSGKMTIQTAIDGYRLIADRTGQLAGISDYIFDTEEGKNPGKATVTVHKIVNGTAREFTASARWSEYSQPSSPMWQKMPYLMLGKCAEALALRKAFPADLSGIYTAEEMAQADNERVADASRLAYVAPKSFNPDAEEDLSFLNDDRHPLEIAEGKTIAAVPMSQMNKPAEGPISAGQAKRLWAISKQVNCDRDRVMKIIGDAGIESVEEIPWRKYNQIIEAIQGAGCE
jgi:phage recombination protein Bet